MEVGVDSGQMALMVCGPQPQHAVNSKFRHVGNKKPCESVYPYRDSVSPSERRHAPSVNRDQRSDYLGCFAGNHQTPTGPRPLPEGSYAASYVDREVAGYQQGQEHEGLNDWPGDMKVLLREHEQAERSDYSHHA